MLRRHLGKGTMPGTKQQAFNPPECEGLSFLISFTVASTFGRRPVCTSCTAQGRRGLHQGVPGLRQGAAMGPGPRSVAGAFNYIIIYRLLYLYIYLLSLLSLLSLLKSFKRLGAEVEQELREHRQLDGIFCTVAMTSCRRAVAWAAAQAMLWQLASYGVKASIHHWGALAGCLEAARRWEQALQLIQELRLATLQPSQVRCLGRPGLCLRSSLVPSWAHWRKRGAGRLACGCCTELKWWT